MSTPVTPHVVEQDGAHHVIDAYGEVVYRLADRAQAERVAARLAALQGPTAATVTLSPAQYDRADADQRRVALFVAVLAAVLVPLAVLVHALGWDGGEDVSTAQTAPGAVCSSAADCAALDYSRGARPLPVLVPASDGGEGYVCPAGWGLYDTENVTVGADGVVCLPATGVRYV